MDYILAHDVGTSGCKAVLISVEGPAKSEAQSRRYGVRDIPDLLPAADLRRARRRRLVERHGESHAPRPGAERRPARAGAGGFLFHPDAQYHTRWTKRVRHCAGASAGWMGAPGRKLAR